MFDITQFRQWIVRPALSDLQLHTLPMEELLVFTCATESMGGTYVHQKNGPALGIYQIEPATFSDLWANYIVRSPNVVNLLSLNFGVNRLAEPLTLICDLRIASAMCALLYVYRKAKPTTTDANDLWEIYKALYNTDAGDAQKENSIKLYNKFTKV